MGAGRQAPPGVKKERSFYVGRDSRGSSERRGSGLSGEWAGGGPEPWVPMLPGTRRSAHGNP